MEGMKLVDVIKAVKPTILIGLSGCGGIFNGNISPFFCRLMEICSGCRHLLLVYQGVNLGKSSAGKKYF